jgi:hypothetical protein
VDVSCCDELQDRRAQGSHGLHVERELELGVGTGEAARRVLGLHERAGLEAPQAWGRCDFPLPSTIKPTPASRSG